MHRALILAAVASCTEPPDIRPPVEQAGVVEVFEAIPAVARIDLLFVVDRSADFAPYVDALAEQLGYFGQGLLGEPVLLDLHLGVITGDVGLREDSPGVAAPGQCAGWGDGGALQQSALVDGTYITLQRTPVADHSNVRGSISAALISAADLRSTGCALSQPLAATALALDANPHDASFLRDDASLAVMIVSSSDYSPGTIESYARVLHAVKRDPNAITVLVASDDARLRALADQFPNRGTGESLAALDLAPTLTTAFGAFVPFGLGPLPVGSPCIEAPLVTPYDCSVRELTTAGEQLLPECGSGVLPCWRIAADARSCAGAKNLALTIDRPDALPPDSGRVEAQCVVAK